MRCINTEEIKKALNIKEAIVLQEEGFRLYSEGKVTVPPVGYIDFGKSTGDVHLKCGWIAGDDIFAVKIAGAFYQNPQLHSLSSAQGIVLVLSAKTGQTKAILNDEGYLTNMRTAIAGLIAAKYLAPRKIAGIGILGTGTQARLQVQLLKEYTDCKKLWIWGRNPEKLKNYANEMEKIGFQTSQAQSISELCTHCNLIITTTAAQRPLINANELQPGTHISAVGADAPGKQELDPEIFRLADLCIADSKSQCLDHGESHHPYRLGVFKEKPLFELGELVIDPKKRRQSEQQITVADLTGIAVQDIQIAKSVLKNLDLKG